MNKMLMPPLSHTLSQRQRGLIRRVEKFVPSKLFVGIAAIMLLQGCSWFGHNKSAADNEPTLASLKSAQLPDTQRKLPQVGLNKVAENYRDVLKNTEDPEMRVRVTQRLADLEMLNSEQTQLASGQPGQHYFDEAIKSYQALLAANPKRADNDKLMYQLSKAYDMDGRNDESLKVLNQLVHDYPHSSVLVEAQFRRGELLFARQQYAAAEGAYASVFSNGVNSQYYQNALYMHGWSQFKQSNYEAALGSFTQTLDKLWPADNKLDAMSRTEREMINDTLRVMSLSFSNLNGATSITETYQRLGDRAYIPELYSQLGQLYLQQKRYRDAAETYRAFVDAHPQAPEAPAMYVQLIDAYNEGNFPSEVLAQKAEFTKLYGIHGSYQSGQGWSKLDEPAREQVRGHLKDFLTELAQFNHSQAQLNKAALAKSATSKDKTPPKDFNGEVVTRAGVLQSYRLAGDYYREYIDSFPQAPDVGAKMFLLAESRFEAEDYPAAIDAYETSAYQYANNERAAEAGYSALIAYEIVVKDGASKQLPADQQNIWQQRRTASEVRFAKTFPQDSRAVNVQTHAAEELFERKDYPAAIAAATPVTMWKPVADDKLRRSAWLIIAHGQFEQQDYAQAEQAYRQASSLIAANDPQRAAIQDRLAASVYKQGEQKLATGDKAGAAQQYLRVAEVAPESGIRVNAQYDAATQFMESGDYRGAINTLNDMRARFPNHALTAGVATKLALAYQSTGQSAAAAAELTRVSQQDGDPATRREALFSAAELYQKAGDTSNASARYREYVQQYPAPFGQAMEARYQVAELMKKSGDTSRKQWLEQIISADAAAGTQRTDRSRYLAAQAQDEIAEAAYRGFVTERLTLPLKESLKRKKTALEAALNAYQRSGDYGVQEFSTKATYRIGEIYSNLADELTKSQRPPNLSALELEQYEVLLEEQADPFVEKAISVHEGNIKRSWNGIYDEWVQKSFTALEKLLPARYRKPETRISVSEEIN